MPMPDPADTTSAGRLVVFCRYPECVACCPCGCRISLRLKIEDWVRRGSYTNARGFWEVAFGGADHVEQTGHRDS